MFGKVEGDLETTKTMDTFTSFGKGTANAANPDYPFSTFNGTDEEHERGVGTIWTENGSMFYRIDQAGTTDWLNKLTCGYTDNPLTLASDSYYTVVKFMLLLIGCLLYNHLVNCNVRNLNRNITQLCCFFSYYEDGIYYIYYLKDGGDSYNHSIYLATTEDFVTYK